MVKPTFICLEGGDGSGKTTIINQLKKELSKQEVVYTREPGGTKIGEAIREILLSNANSEMDLRTEALLFAAARRQHLVEIVRPALHANKLVVMDRFIDSSLVYQGYARGIGMEEVNGINQFATEGLYPDIVFYIDLDPVVAKSRMRTRSLNRLDQETDFFHQQVREGYLLIAKKNKRFRVMDGQKSVEQLVKEILDEL